MSPSNPSSISSISFSFDIQQIHCLLCFRIVLADAHIKHEHIKCEIEKYPVKHTNLQNHCEIILDHIKYVSNPSKIFTNEH